MEEAFLRQLLSSRFFASTWQAFEMLHSEPFQPSPHVRAICHALEKVARGETMRLLITVPPRHGKSICTSVALPAWMMGLDPSLKIMVASYGSDLASTHARHFRQVVTSPSTRKCSRICASRSAATGWTNSSRPRWASARPCHLADR